MFYRHFASYIFKRLFVTESQSKKFLVLSFDSEQIKAEINKSNHMCTICSRRVSKGSRMKYFASIIVFSPNPKDGDAH